ncbi:restriction endonuclease subunit S [Bradyrhizobium sp. USDA 329]|uniref:restriction endonuclease subunit S n=1 Tax=unclassified Bradyrhizobium TaxID=2631580 RepID=UPI003511D962
MSFPRYPRYKDSGVEWLGRIPEHWDVLRATHLFNEVAEQGSEDLPILSVSIHDGVSDDELNDEQLDRKVSRSDDRSKYKRVQPDDLVYNMMRAWQGGFGTVRATGMVSPAYVVARPKSRFSTVFVEHLLRTPNAIEEMRRHSHGVTDFRLRLYWDSFKDLYLTLPPHDEQLAIIDFLHREVAKIDALVSEQQRLIELLKEKRQAVISDAVTKGLDRNAPTRRTGIEGMDEVPTHWEVKRIKHLSAFISKGTTPTTIGAEFVETGVRFLKAENITDGRVSSEPEFFISPETHRLMVRSNLHDLDVLVVIAGATTGKSAVVTEDLLPANTNQAVAFVRCRDKRHAAFVNFWMSTAFVQERVKLASVQSAQPNLSMEDLGNMQIPVPSPAEQTQILDYLDAELGRLDALTGEAAKAIELLEEHRVALISAAVTGKIDLRGLAGAKASTAVVAA